MNKQRHYKKSHMFLSSAVWLSIFNFLGILTNMLSPGFKTSEPCVTFDAVTSRRNNDATAPNKWLCVAIE